MASSLPCRAASVAASLCALTLAACQLKSTPPSNGYLTAIPADFTIHNVDRYDAGDLNGTDTMIVLVSATYTNNSANSEIISPDKFEIVDQELEAVYQGLSGGDVRIPPMTTTTLAPGKTVDITVGFRVPAAMASGRLVYYP
jgi:hypothetical protein